MALAVAPRPLRDLVPLAFMALPLAPLLVEHTVLIVLVEGTTMGTSNTFSPPISSYSSSSLDSDDSDALPSSSSRSRSRRISSHDSPRFFAILNQISRQI